MVRDTTNFKQTTILGARDLFIFDQGVGPSFYNCFMVTVTRFIRFSKQTDCVKMPASLVLHGKVDHVQKSRNFTNFKN
jgi:hypothetical protein